MSNSGEIGAFVCSCADTCDIDLDTARERVEDVAMAASSDLLCEKETVGDICSVVEDRDLEELILTCPAAAGQERLERIERETGATVHFVDQREGAGWVHDKDAATEKTARLVNAARAGLDVESEPASVGGNVGRSVAVVGDAQLAAAMPESADVTLVADGQEFDDVGTDLSDVRLERGRVLDVSGSLGNIEITLEARVTEDCIDCMECVRAGPDDAVTRTPVDVDPDAPGGEWVDVCPTDAIDLDGGKRTVSFDQVVFPDGEDDAPGGTTGYHTDADLGTIAAVSDLLEPDRPSYLDLEMDVCASGDSGQEGCRACYDACPHEAVSKPAPHEVSFDLSACQNCGACTSSCPTGAVELADRSNERLAREVEALLDEEPSGGLLDWSSTTAIDPQVIAFVCSERAETALSRYGQLAASGREDVSYPPILPVRVNCTDTVGQAHVLHALAAGADGVTIVGCGCDCAHSGPDPKSELVERLNAATTDLGLGERVAFLAPEPDAPHAFADELSAFVDDLTETSIPADEHDASGTALGADNELPAYGNRVWTLESIRAILEHVDPERKTIRGLENFGTMSVSEACGLTPTCENLCPTGAIRRDEGNLEFSHERCVDCGLCETGCPESAITMDTGLDLGLLPEYTDGDAWTTVHEEELFECRSCGAVVASVSTVEDLKAQLPDGQMDTVEGHMAEYCSNCKGDLVFNS
ncbi:hydrogenase iron-sulfur subunit [Natronorubrum bangense]|uniref:Methyl-viologen-reducing hydrogenase subunit delta n=2 Tax=Natronorubrum bangense TaxID=61858 RepID=L9WB26_9EURY|nr:hydrogenase iron-sulfur subunit [Natronorubrum bangense]ELY46557.1 methyl-viologen-reducing hydrogenase subunit delta [Natronorubrum bangense JCM 10635]QCC56558.1 hydrogenase iron-sulfur subunit [Natronorubrum bangense]